MAVKQLDQISSSENQNVDINTILTLIQTYRQENGYNRINLTELYENFVYILSNLIFFFKYIFFYFNLLFNFQVVLKFQVMQ